MTSVITCMDIEFKLSVDSNNGPAIRINDYVLLGITHFRVHEEYSLKLWGISREPYLLSHEDYDIDMHYLNDFYRLKVTAIDIE